MPDIFVTLRSLIESLPEAEKKVAEYALRNPGGFPFLSIYEVAEKVGVSAATVTRFTKKLGVKNLKEVKIKFAQNMDAALAAVFEGISKNDTKAEIIKKVFGGNIRSLEDTLNVIDFTALEKTAEAILRYRRVFFAGAGSSGFIAEDAALRFAHLGISAFALRDPFDMAVRSRLIPPGSVCVCISHSGRTKSAIAVLEAAKKNKAVTVGISNYPESPVAKICDFFLCTAFREALTRAAAVSSRISQICIIDALHVLTAGDMRNSRTAETVNALVEREFRIK